MDFALTPEQDELIGSVRTVLARECPTDLVRSVVEGTGSPDALWKRMVELGWPALALPESVGGIGYGPVELTLLVEELGRVVAPGPFLATVTRAAPLLLEAGDTEVVARIAAGEITATAVLPHDVVPPSLDGLSVSEADGGTCGHVLDAATADQFAVPTRDGWVHVMGRADVVVHDETPLDASRPLGTVTVTGPLSEGTRVGRLDDAGLARSVEHATLAVAAETVGVTQAILDLTVAYAKVREQFDRPIGSFQGVKHQLADGFVAVERARATTQFAAMCLAESDDRRALGVSMAKAVAGETADLLGYLGIQLHGGIGYTWEHDVHLLVKRAMANAQTLGTAVTHRARIADLLKV